MLDVLGGNEGQFRVRTNYSKSLKQKVFWADSAVDDYLHRPTALEDCCLFDYLSQCEKVCKTFKQMNAKAQDTSDLVDDVAGESDFTDYDSSDKFETEEFSTKTSKYLSLESHPGYELLYLQERKHVDIPIISIPKGNICQIEDLDIGNCIPNSTTLSEREIYSKTACVMFLPFRQPADLASSATASYWTNYQKAIDENNFCQSCFEVLQHIKEREGASKARSAEESLK